MQDNLRMSARIFVPGDRHNRHFDYSLEEPLHNILHKFGVERLIADRGNAELIYLGQLLWIIFGCDHNDRHLGLPALLANKCHQLQTIHLRHVVIRDDQIKRLLAHSFNAASPIVGVDEPAETNRCQYRLNVAPRYAAVIDNQHIQFVEAGKADQFSRRL